MNKVICSNWVDCSGRDRRCLHIEPHTELSGCEITVCRGQSFYSCRPLSDSDKVLLRMVKDA